MAIALVRHTSTPGSGSSGTASASLGASSAAGDLVLAGVVAASTVATPSGWSLAASVSDGSGSGYGYLFYQSAASVSSFSASLGSSGRWMVGLAEYSGAATTPSSPTASDSNLGGSSTTGSLAAGATGALMIGVLGDSGDGSGFGALSDGFTKLCEFTSGGTFSACMLGLLATTTGTSYGSVGSGGEGTLGLLSQFLPAGSGFAVNVPASAISGTGTLPTAVAQYAWTQSAAAISGTGTLGTDIVSAAATPAPASLTASGTLPSDAGTGGASDVATPLVGSGSIPAPSYAIGSAVFATAYALASAGSLDAAALSLGVGFPAVFLGSSGIVSDGNAQLSDNAILVSPLVGSGVILGTAADGQPLPGSGSLPPVNIVNPPNLTVQPNPFGSLGTLSPGFSIGFGLSFAISPLAAAGMLPPIATATAGNLAESVSPLVGSGMLRPARVWTNWTGLGLVYSVYGDDGAGGPIDYSSPLAVVPSLSWSPGSLAYPGSYRFGVRAASLVSSLEEKNLDASVPIILDPTGADVTHRPPPPFALRAIPLAGGRARLEWAYPNPPPGNAPTGFRVYAGPPGSVDYGTVKATASYGGSRLVYSADVAGLADGVTYALGVRPFNAYGEDPNTSTASVLADTTGPAAVLSLASTASSSAG